MKPARLLLAAIAGAAFSVAAYAQPDRLGLTLDATMLVEDASGPAASAGIQPGDKLLAVDGTPVEGAQTLQPFENVTGTVALLVRRGDETFYVPVLLDDHPLQSPAAGASLAP
jgi:S1-C subfamily serine protease